MTVAISALTPETNFGVQAKPCPGSIELEYAPDPKRVVAWVEEAYHETARLMEQVGWRG